MNCFQIVQQRTETISFQQMYQRFSTSRGSQFSINSIEGSEKFHLIVMNVNF